MNIINCILTKLLFSFLLCFAANTALADPPTRVLRLSVIEGTVTFAPAGVDEWVYATRNRPITTGDRLWSDSNSLAELQLDTAAIRLGDSTSIEVLNIDDKTAQIELDQGILNVHVWNISGNKEIEVDTPNLALSVNQPGDYRIEVNPTDNTTTITVLSGVASVYGEDNSYQIDAGKSYRFSGTQLNDYEEISLAEPDAFDKWTTSRNSIRAKVSSHKYVSSQVIGYEELDTYGNWQSDTTYGSVWYPNNRPSNWAPYSQGNWVWIDPWGWTWIDEEPWGFAPFHYGRWAYINHNWGWIPCPLDYAPVYAPALVAFFEGSGFDLALSFGAGGGIGWFPLGPGDIYIPPYSYSNNYFNIVNIHNTIIAETVVQNIYNNPNQVINYRNLVVPNAVTALSRNGFIQSQSVANAGIKVPKNALDKIHPKAVAALAPVSRSVVGSSKTTSIKPSGKALGKPIIAKTSPKRAIPFSEKQALLAKNPGKPLTPAALSAIKPKKVAPQVKLAKPSQPKAIPTSARKPGGPAAPKTQQMRPQTQVPRPTLQKPSVIQHKPIKTAPTAPTAPVMRPRPIPARPQAAPVVRPPPAPVRPQAAPVVKPRPAPVRPQAAPVVRPRPAPVRPQAAPVVRPRPAPVRPQAAPVVRPRPAPVRPQAAPVVRPRPAAPVVRPRPAPVRPYAAPVVRPHPAPVRPHAAPVVRPRPAPVVRPHSAPVRPQRHQ